MNQVIVNVEEKKFDFFMELLKKLDFISLPKENKAKKETLKQIAEGIQFAFLAGKNKVKTRPAKAFLDEL